MADNDVSIRFDADIRDLVAGIDTAKDSIESMRSSLTRIAGALGPAFALDAVKDFTAGLDDLGKQADRLAGQLGLSKEKAIEFAGAAKMSGTPAEAPSPGGGGGPYAGAPFDRAGTGGAGTKSTAAGVLADQKAIAGALGQVQKAWDSQLRGLLAGTETFKQAMKKVFADLVIDAIKEFEKLAIVKPLASVLSGGSASGPGTLLGLLGGAGEAGGSGGSLGLFGALVAGAGKLLGSVAMFDAGSFSVPSNMLAMVHQGEMIVPAQGGYADAMRAALSGGGASGDGGGAPTIHINGPVIGTQAWINSMVPQLAKALSSHRALNPSTA